MHSFRSLMTKVRKGHIRFSKRLPRLCQLSQQLPMLHHHHRHKRYQLLSLDVETFHSDIYCRGPSQLPSWNLLLTQVTSRWKKSRSSLPEKDSVLFCTIVIIGIPPNSPKATKFDISSYCLRVTGLLCLGIPCPCRTANSGWKHVFEMLLPLLLSLGGSCAIFN